MNCPNLEICNKPESSISILDTLVETDLISRIELAGRKVIFYVDGLSGGEERSFSFQVKARFPVRALIPDSKAYLYYQPNVRAEDQGKEITVQLAQNNEGYNIENLRALANMWLLPVDTDDVPENLYGDDRIDLRDFVVLAEHWLINDE